MWGPAPRHSAPCSRAPRRRGMPHLPRELVAALGALELPHALVPADVDAQLLHRCEGKREPVGSGPAPRRGGRVWSPPTARRPGRYL